MANQVVSREDWLAARAELLNLEKAHTQARAELAAKRREMPWVRIDKNYVFAGPQGEVDLAGLFAGTSQLAIYHLMFGDGWDRPCPGCTSWAYAFDGTTYQFQHADANLVAVSRAPYEQIAEQQEQLGWSFTWVSSAANDFGIDFFASSDDREGTTRKTIGGDGGEIVEFDRGENHGVSVFCREDDTIYHTYSTYNRGIEDLNGAFGYFDLLPKGRAW